MQFNRPFELTPLIYDDPSTLIIPAALFVMPDGEFTIIDAGSNSSRLKIYSPEGVFVKGEIPSYSTEGQTAQPSPSFNPFGPAPWIERTGKIYLLEARESGQTLKVISDSSGYEVDLPPKYSFHLIDSPSKAVLFNSNGLADSEGEITLPLNLEGYDKVTIDKEGNIYALSLEGLGKFNQYGIPQWNRLFPEKPEGQFIPVSFAAIEGNILVAGILLPSGVKASKFRSDYEAMLSANPSLPPEEIRHLLGNLQRTSTPLLISYSARAGKAGSGLELGGIPIWVETNADDDVFVLSYKDGKTIVSRIAPGLSEELPLFTVELGERVLKGTTEIAASSGSLYYDCTEISYDENGEYQEKLTIERRQSDGKGSPEKFAAYSIYSGGYLVAGLAANANGNIYCAGSKFSFSPDGKIIPGGVFLDSYDPSGTRLLDCLSGSEQTLIPNALAITPEGDIIIAMAYETQSLSRPWAMRFSPDGHLLKEFSYLDKAGISEINMVAGGTIAVGTDGVIYQCDNIRPPDPGKAYMRLFDMDGNYSADLTKFSLISSGLLGIAGDEAILSWQERYLLHIKSEVIISQADLGPHFADADVLGVTSASESMYMLSSNGVIYELPIDEEWDKKSYPSDDVEVAADELRNIVMDYINTYGFPPEKLDYKFLSEQKKEAELDGLLEVFFGPGPFDYQDLGQGEFSFLLLGRDPYQSLLRVTRTGVKPVL